MKLRVYRNEAGEIERIVLVEPVPDTGMGVAIDAKGVAQRVVPLAGAWLRPLIGE